MNKNNNDNNNNKEDDKMVKSMILDFINHLKK